MLLYIKKKKREREKRFNAIQSISSVFGASCNESYLSRKIPHIYKYLHNRQRFLNINSHFNNRYGIYGLLYPLYFGSAA